MKEKTNLILLSLGITMATRMSDFSHFNNQALLLHKYKTKDTLFQLQIIFIIISGSNLP